MLDDKLELPEPISAPDRELTPEEVVAESNEHVLGVCVEELNRAGFKVVRK